MTNRGYYMLLRALRLGVEPLLPGRSRVKIARLGRLGTVRRAAALAWFAAFREAILQIKKRLAAERSKSL